MGIPKKRHGNWRGGRHVDKYGYVCVLKPRHPRAHRNRYVYEHILVVERATGIRIKSPHEIHHVNEDKADNRNSNLVVCEDKAYHALLHRRARALQACGNANFKKCRYCKRWCDPSKLTNGSRQSWHPRCNRKYQRERLANNPRLRKELARRKREARAAR